MGKLTAIKNMIMNRRSKSGPDYRDLAAVLLFIFLLPYIVSFFFGSGVDKDGKRGEAVKEEGEAGIWNGRDRQELFGEDISKAEFIVCNTTAAGTEKMSLETYLVSRLPSTIDMEYEMEALKAQAVVLRTEMMRSYYDSGESRQDGKAYIYVESQISQTDGNGYEKSKEAVSSTKGMYLAYDGYPLIAPYFKVSAGATRNGNEVLGGTDYPYLKSVMCGRDFTSDDYVHSLRMSRDTFLAKLKEWNQEIDWKEGESLEELFPTVKDRAGYVTEINIGGHIVSGELFRSAFMLHSSCFEMEGEGDTVMIKTKGVGHGLGFCQYGANEAAKKGSDFIDILNYFFADVVIEKWNMEN